MGWCSGTYVFDAVIGTFVDQFDLNDPSNISRFNIMLEKLNDALVDQDWDCEQDSEYYDHPLVQAFFKEKYPHWFEDEDDDIDADYCITEGD